MLGFFHESIVSRVFEVVGKLYGATVFPYLWMFLLGVFLCDNKERCLGFLKRGWFPLLAVAYVVIKSGCDIHLLHYGLVAGVLSFMGFLGFAYRFPQLNLKVDVSYAVYVYHMVAVNAFITLGFTGSLWYLPLVFVISFAIGFASTKTIGAFGIRKKTKAG